jgi:hypothetical protein
MAIEKILGGAFMVAGAVTIVHGILQKDGLLSSSGMTILGAGVIVYNSTLNNSDSPKPKYNKSGNYYNSMKVRGDKQ